MADNYADHHWLTTAPNPKSPATGHDAGQRGWRLHLVYTHRTSTFKDVRYMPAACGLRPVYGWGLDLFIDRKCKQCLRKQSRITGGKS